jgi:ribonuclease BN (tRNA processing enzyme)
MRLRILGARQGESLTTHYGAFLIDDTIALDAGSITTLLRLDEQQRLRDVVLTHHHFDHVKDLAPLGLNLRNLSSDAQVNVWCTELALMELRATLFRGNFWIDYFTWPTPEHPAYLHHAVVEDKPFVIADYRFRGIPVPHPLPTLAYEVIGPDGSTLLYTGDNGKGAGAAWARSRPGLLVTECTVPNALAEVAERAQHLTPALLEAELEAFRSAAGYVPTVLLVHVNPAHEATIRAEVAAVADRLGTPLTIAEERTELVVPPATC